MSARNVFWFGGLFWAVLACLAFSRGLGRCGFGLLISAWFCWLAAWWGWSGEEQ